MVTFTEEILNGKFDILYIANIDQLVMIMKAFASICLLSISMGVPNYEFKKLKNSTHRKVL